MGHFFTHNIRADRLDIPQAPHAGPTVRRTAAAFDWGDRGKDAYLLPGGYEQYLVSLGRILDHVAQLRPSNDDLNQWIQEAFTTSVSNASHISRFVRTIGFLHESAGQLNVSEVGDEFLTSRSDALVITQLHSRVRFVGEMLHALVDGPASSATLLRTANDKFAMGWSTKAQIQRRRGWLQSANMVTVNDDHTLGITSQGRCLLPLLNVLGAQPPAMVALALVPTPVATDRRQSSAGSTRSLIGHLKRASTNSSSPDDFEKAVRNVFEFLGFRTEKLHPSGKTVIVASADLGLDDSYRIIIEAKTTNKGAPDDSAITDDSVDWDALQEHLNQHHADYAAIAGSSFSGDSLRDRAAKHHTTLLAVSDLADIVRLHTETPLGLDAYRELFRGPGADTGLEALAESAEEIDRLTNVALAVMSNIERHVTQVGSLNACDLFVLLRSTTELDADETEIATALQSLASPMIGLLTESSGAFRPSGPRRSALMRLRTLQTKFSVTTA